MTRVLLCMLLLLLLPFPSYAAEFTAPEVPRMGAEYMPQNTESFGDAVWELTQRIIYLIHPELENAIRVGVCLIAAVMILSVFSILSFRIHKAVSTVGATAIATVMFQNVDSMIRLASDAIHEICEYGKLLCPVMTMSLAAQGGITTSAALYTGTTVFITIMSMLVSKVLVPMAYIFLIFSVCHCALETEALKKISETVKGAMSWLLKTLLIVSTSYMSITGVVSGTTDAATLKAAKVTISSVVPVVGGILSDASDAVLVSIGVLKNAAGIYGILAVLAVFAGPFVKVGVQFLVLKITAGICGIFGEKHLTALIEEFSAAMGLLLGMVAACCMLVLFSTVCFMRGAGA